MLVRTKKTLKGSTLVEVVTGVLLIALGMALSIVVYTRTMENSNLYVKHQAVNAVNELVIRQEKAMKYIPVGIDTASMRISSTLAPFKGHQHLQVITYSVVLTASSKTIYERKLIKRMDR